jgi:hypothetical protein
MSRAEIATAEARDKADAALAKVTAQRDEARRRLLCACTYIDLDHDRNEWDVSRLLGVERYELPALLGDAENVNWICKPRGDEAKP